ncbi:macrophage mannose receptor 1-like [Plakobranchus ocellatus]|uniref:Macrophage mannose receptor 1-like n=1 Tax=Plakobranchus ocellatus TaxID=259542 RepID=A0AAV3Z5W4_9GAST|nr:macrophage mannose receptor 1-like [Plakobranchus ocellatus]
MTSMYTELTCQEFCRGQDSPLSFWRGGLQYCSCLDKLPDLTEERQSLCVKAEGEDTYTTTGRIFFTELLPSLQASSCAEIFNYGIFVNGRYYINNGEKVFCNFYDGSTVCDHGWLSYRNNCYSFVSEQMHADGHFESCAGHGSLLVSVSDQAEWDFLTLALSRIGYMKDFSVYIGLYDTQKTFSYMWSDETAVTLRKFYTGYPSNVDHRCIVFSKGSGTMLNVDCAASFGAVCERSSAVVGCVAIEPLNFAPIITSAVMTTPLCFETCRSTGVLYSLTKGEACYCVNDTSSFINIFGNWSACDRRCPGNEFQICGANNTDNVFVVKDVGQPYRTDCRDMVLGSVKTNVTLMNAATGETIVVDCHKLVGGRSPFHD